MSATDSNPYDDLPYEFIAYEQSHPDRIATMAAMFGLRPPPVDCCRVLEIGCALGGNLIPMAEALPGSHFVGIDTSARQIENGRQIAAQLQLGNLELLPMNLQDVGPDFGTFDYIIAHGVMSWVPQEAQQHLLQICGRNLSSNGIAYVSYNTYPGWHLRRLIRDMLIQHAAFYSEPAQKVSQARRFVSLMTSAVSRQTDAYSRFMQAELQRLDGLHDSYLAHEHLEEVNEPFYFADFVERAGQYGLQYLCDAEPAITMSAGIEADVTDELRRLCTDAIHLEQCRDFLRNQMFRRTLLCRAGIPHSHRPHVEQVGAFYVSSELRPLSSNPDPHSDEDETFAAPDGRQIEIGDRLEKAALLHLWDHWPEYLTVDRLSSVARERLEIAPNDETTFQIDRSRLGQWLTSLWADESGPLVNLQLCAPRFATIPSDRPKASGLTRLKATAATKVTNGRHQTVGLDDFHRQLLMLLDGTRDVAAMVEQLTRLRNNGAFELGEREELFDADPGEFVRQRIQDVAASALLVE